MSEPRFYAEDEARAIVRLVQGGRTVELEAVKLVKARLEATWLDACRRAAKAAWEAETHHDAVEAINKIAGAIVFEP